MRPFHAQHEFNVSSPTVAWQARKETRSTFFAFTGGSLDRYDNTTYAYYEATVPTSATMNGDFAARAKHWGRPEEAVVNIYQSAYWYGYRFIDISTIADTRNTTTHRTITDTDTRNATLHRTNALAAPHECAVLHAHTRTG